MEYTKGEWQTLYGGEEQKMLVVTDRVTIASIWPHKEKGETNANAHLIKSAPKLYEALKGWLNWFGTQEGVPPITKSEQALAGAEDK